jgi:hypothetical protein
VGLPQGLQLFGQVHGLFGHFMAPAAAQGWRVGLTVLGEHQSSSGRAVEVPVVAYQLDDLHGLGVGDGDTLAGLPQQI